MLRIYFTAQDLARVTIAAEPDPMWELLLSLHMAQGDDCALVFGHWRREVRRSVPSGDLDRQAVRSYHDTALLPYWRSIRQHVVADRARRVAQLAALGVDHLLANLHPGVRWKPPVLQIPEFAGTDVRLEGRGLLLQPSFFCWKPTVRPHILVYPTQPPPGTLQRQGKPVASSASSLESLIGRTRAMALEATVAGCTTSALARVCGISVGAASQQATVLRDAALITTRRDGLAVLHEITPLGLTLLTATTAGSTTQPSSPN